MNCSRMNYWKPNGNVFVGDCMPFYRNGVFHLYYLWDIGHHNHPLVGLLGGHQFAHATSADLLHWQLEPMALKVDFENGECSNCTGSMLEYQGQIFAFYALRSRLFGGEQFRIAVSDDEGRTFRKWKTPELEAPPESGGQFRDPKAFIGEDGLVHILISSGASEKSGEISVRTGEVAHYTSPDLIHYKREAPWLRSWFIPECCDYFKWGDLYYYTYNICWETHVRYSKQPFGPWAIPPCDVPASKFCCVMKTAPWKDGRRIGVGWVPSWVNNSPQFGGKTVFRELVREKDGALGTAFVPEMIPSANEKHLAAFELEGNTGLAVRHIGVFPDEFRLDGTISFRPDTAEFGIAVKNRAQDTYNYAAFEPGTETVSVNSARINKVNMDSGTVSFRLIRTHDITDLEIDGKRTIVAPSHDFAESFTTLYLKEGKAAFRDLKVYTW